MKLALVSHKDCWPISPSVSGWGATGGFPFQIESISHLFDEVTLVVPEFKGGSPAGLQVLEGHNLSVRPLEGPPGRDTLRKLSLLFWLPRNLPRIWQEVRRADAVHAPVPGDIGTIGILVALAQAKPLFVRHCGTWGYRGTLANRFLLWLLERIAGGRNVIVATGGGESPPSQRNAAIGWVFATTLTEQELVSLPCADLWEAGKPLKMITVARLDPAKNVESAVRALPLVREHYPQTTLEIVGDGSCLEGLKVLAGDLGVKETVVFRGRLAHREVLDRLSNSHVFVFPTRVHEGFPKAVLEAMACGLPAVVPPISVLPYLVGNRNGVMLKGTDANSVAEAVLHLIADGRRFAEMSANARQDARRYSLERWRELIGAQLTAAWGQLREEAPCVADSIRAGAGGTR